MKKCTKCGEVKPLDEFRKNKARKDGLTIHCKACKKAYDILYFENNKHKIYEYRKSYRQKVPHILAWRNLLNNTLKALGTSKENDTQSALMYSALELKLYLEELGMNWNTHHIDHKVPITWFKRNTPPHLVNDLRNLTPLEAKENKSKSNRVSSPINQAYYNQIASWVKLEYLKFLLIKDD